MAGSRSQDWGVGGLFSRGVQEQVRHNAEFSSTPGATGASPSTSEADSGVWAQPPSGSPWLRWLRPRGTGSTGRRSSGHSTPNAVQPNAVPLRAPASAGELVARHQFDALEDRLLSLFAGMHQQVVADRQEGDRLVERSASRLEAQIGMTEQQQQRIDRRISDMSVFIQSLDEEQQNHVRRVSHVSDVVQSLQASRGQSEQEVQRRLTDLEQDQRALVSATHAAAARDEEAQRRYLSRLRPLEERLCVLENEQRCPEACGSPCAPRSCLSTSPGSCANLSALRDLETSIAEETRAIHARCDHMQDVVDSSAIRPMQQLGRQLEKLSAADNERKVQAKAHETQVASMNATLDAHDRQLREVRERLERLVLINSSDTGPSTPASQQKRLPATISPQRARVEELPKEASERFDDLERRVRHNALATTKLQDNLRIIQRSLSDIKGSIDMAICERQAHSDESFGIDGGHSAIPNEPQDTTLQSSEASEHISRLSETLSLHRGQLQELPRVADRLTGVETSVKNIGEALSALRYDLSMLAGESSSRREAEAVEARDNVQRFERFERLVSEIQSQLMEFGRQQEEFLASPMRPHHCGIEESELDDDVASRSLHILAPQHDGSPSASLLQADALLRTVEQVVGRQQAELARLTANLHLQCAEIANASGMDSEFPELAVTKPLGREEEPREEEPSTSLSSPAANNGEVRTKQVDDDNLKVESSEQSPKVRGQSFLSRSSAPWSALAQLSATLSGFEAALDGAEMNVSTPQSVSHACSEPPSTGRPENQSARCQPSVPPLTGDVKESPPQPELGNAGWDAVASWVIDRHTTIEKEVTSLSPKLLEAA